MNLSSRRFRRRCATSTRSWLTLPSYSSRRTSRPSKSRRSTGRVRCLRNELALKKPQYCSSRPMLRMLQSTGPFNYVNSTSLPALLLSSTLEPRSPKETNSLPSGAPSSKVTSPTPQSMRALPPFPPLSRISQMIRNSRNH